MERRGHPKYRGAGREGLEVPLSGSEAVVVTDARVLGLGFILIQ